MCGRCGFRVPVSGTALQYMWCDRRKCGHSAHLPRRSPTRHPSTLCAIGTRGPTSAQLPLSPTLWKCTLCARCTPHAQPHRARSEQGHPCAPSQYRSCMRLRRQCSGMCQSHSLYTRLHRPRSIGPMCTACSSSYWTRTSQPGTSCSRTWTTSCSPTGMPCTAQD